MSYSQLISACYGDAVVIALILLALLMRALEWRGLAGNRIIPSATAFALALVFDAAVSVTQVVGKPPGDLFNGQLFAYPPGLILKAFILLIAATIVILARADRREAGEPLRHVPVALGAVALGFVCVGENLTILFLGLEFAGFTVCALVAGRRGSPRTTEAAWKQFVAGGMASAFLLFGFSYFYGATNLLNVDLMDNKFSELALPSPLLTAGMLFMLAGLALRSAAAPFHGWAPDVGAGAPPLASAWIFAAVRFAALLVLIKVMSPMQEYWELKAIWGALCATLAVASLIVGTLGFVTAKDLGRRLAFVAIAQTGQALCAIALQTIDGFTVALYLALTDGLALLAIYGVQHASAARPNETTSPQLSGLSARSPVLAWVFTVAALSLAGIPPLPGFIARFQFCFAAMPSAPLYEDFPPFSRALIVVSLIAGVASLAAWLPLVAEVWRTPAAASEAIPSARRSAMPDLVILAFIALVLVAVGLIPSFLVDLLHRGVAGEL